MLDIFPESRNATNSRISGARKGEPAGNLGSTLPGPCPHLPCGVFLKSTVPAFSSFSRHCPTYQLHFPPKTLQMGDPKIRNRDGPGNSGKFRVSVEFAQKPLVRVIPGNSFWGPHFSRLGDFLGEMRMAKVDMLGRGEVFLNKGRNMSTNFLCTNFSNSRASRGARHPLGVDSQYLNCETNPPPFYRRTNVQQLTCNIDLSCSFYYLFFSFALLELKPFVWKRKVLGEKV